MLQTSFEQPTMVPNQILRDKDLSLSAKGAFAVMIYLITEEGRVTPSYMETCQPEVKELMKNGYLVKDGDGLYSLELP